MILEFEDHWRAKNKGSNKELWQMQRVFDTGRRLSTWKRKNEGWAHDREQKLRLKSVNERPLSRNERSPGEPSRVTFNN